MLKLTINDIREYWYILRDFNNKQYEINIEFYDIKQFPKKGDSIYMDERLLQEINHSVASFGKLDGIYGKKINAENFEDVIVVQINGEYIYLKRYYG